MIYYPKSEIPLEQISSINLSYNVVKNNSTTRKFIDDKGCANFYIGNEHFRAKEDPKVLGDKDIKNIFLVDITEFNKLASEERKKHINEGEKIGKIHIVPNEDIFDNIFLFERIENSKILKHKVIWIDEIVD